VQQTIDVEYVEPTGADLYVNGKSGGQDIVVRVERTIKVAPGDKLPVRWQLDQALVFDTATGYRL
jgi:ABC-type sugar transport system ATPase subunit